MVEKSTTKAQRPFFCEKLKRVQVLPVGYGRPFCTKLPKRSYGRGQTRVLAGYGAIENMPSLPVVRVWKENVEEVLALVDTGVSISTVTGYKEGRLRSTKKNWVWN